MAFAEQFALPTEGEIGGPFSRRNDLGEWFRLRWGRIRFDLSWGKDINLKVLLKVFRRDGTCEKLLVDTDPYEIEWDRHKRVTRDFYLLPESAKFGRISCVKFAFIVHRGENSIPSEHEYVLFDSGTFDSDTPVNRRLSANPAGPNIHHTIELDPGILQRDVDWHNKHFESLAVVQKFTRGVVSHPYHPKRYIHDRIDAVIWQHKNCPQKPASIKVCVDCIDDTDFVSHLLYAASQGVDIQCIVDWRKMTLTNSDNYVRLKRSSIDLLGVFCSSRDPRVEVSPDMHMKFILFGDEDCLEGSFNITFDRWGANWESGLTFRSFGVSRLLDNIFQSIRGGVIQRYEVEAFSHFNLLYTFGRHFTRGGKVYRPPHAILSEINRARRSIHCCLFLLGEMQGEFGDSVVDALISAQRRGVDVQLILNGHVIRQGDPTRECTMDEELRRPLIPAVARLERSGISVFLAYGVHDQRVPYCPLHAKYCVIDQQVVLDGSFNWYNTSVFSHDLLVTLSNSDLARAYHNEFDYTRGCLRFPSLHDHAQR
ncbi:MAG: phosphatidylserine/phosphatidylglycerophosphate/cardiolipin synthase family protein [Verrucomicrobia bacterium]|nr:phosphatidylserine/phosphatidylglycerophosphate/cardiolipin synthase family protein [Verrucomicrobiota bacterium]